MTQEYFIGEYGVQLKFRAPEDFRGTPRELSEAFYLGLQREAPDWIQIGTATTGTTKTAMIYRMGKTPVVSHE